MLVGVQPGAWKMLERAGYFEEEGMTRIVAHKGDALRTVYPLLDNDICRRCTVRLFEECQHALPNGEPRVKPTGGTEVAPIS
jgi:SulP family sulfate permease